MDDDYEEIYFWETDGIYDTDGDLKVCSLLLAYNCSMQEALYICYDFLLNIEEIYVEVSL